MNIYNRILVITVFFNCLFGQDNYLSLDLNNEWKYDYTFEIESVTGELDDFIVTVDENQKVVSLDSIGDYYAYKVDRWQQDSTLVMSSWFTQNGSGLFSVASYYSNDPPRSELNIKFGGMSFKSINEFYSILINLAYGDTTIYDTARLILKYPLTDSSSWIWFSDPWNAIRTVDGDEAIETTAGIFECKRIRIDYDLADEIVFYEWWSQDLGMIKRDVSVYNMIHINENGDSLGLFNSYGIWELKETNFLKNINDTPDLAYSYKVYPAYPNPFNPRTTISYWIPQTSFVIVKIYNLNGQLVESLVNEQKTKGLHYVGWNANNLSSGTYIYLIQSNNFNDWGKCLLIK